jgi:hypothetical protein
MATNGRRDSLRFRSLHSVRRQICTPTTVILIADSCAISHEEVEELMALFGETEFVLLQNRRTAGAAGAWNTGLGYLLSAGFGGFVALLDDDDEWDEDHLAVNLGVALESSASVVISGLRLKVDGVLSERPLPRNLSERMFLTGNPGWQGSNTFVAMRALTAVGGFRDGMPSANDRDLALRLLRWPEVHVAYTHKWTATWHLSSARQALSSPCSATKLRGLRWFWNLYGQELSHAESEEFFTRADALFGFGRDEILAGSTDHPPHRELRGDLL